MWNAECGMWNEVKRRWGAGLWRGKHGECGTLHVKAQAYSMERIIENSVYSNHFQSPLTGNRKPSAVNETNDLTI